MIHRFARFAVLVCLCSAATIAPAWAQGFAGQWGCQMTYTEFSGPNARTGGYTRNFGIVFYPNHTYQAAGTQLALNGQTQFQSQGQWREQEGGIYAQGPERSNDPYDYGGGMFGFFARIDPDGALSLTYEQADPNQQYVMTRTIIYCERQG